MPNFENPTLVGNHSMTIVASICIVMLVVLSSLRLWAKLTIMRKMTIDDCRCNSVLPKTRSLKMIDFFWFSVPALLLVLSLYLYCKT